MKPYELIDHGSWATHVFLFEDATTQRTTRVVFRLRAPTGEQRLPRAEVSVEFMAGSDALGEPRWAPAAPADIGRLTAIAMFLRPPT